MSDEQCSESSQEDKTPGIFSWNELLTQNPDESLKFYTDLFGWTVESMEMPGGTYHCLMAGERPVAGLVQPPVAEVPTQWNSYVTVENLEDAVAKAEALGATICMPPTDIPGKGRFASLSDPQGAAISLWQFV